MCPITARGLCSWNTEEGWEMGKPGARSCRAPEVMVRTYYFVLSVMEQESDVIYFEFGKNYCFVRSSLSKARVKAERDLSGTLARI